MRGSSSKCRNHYRGSYLDPEFSIFVKNIWNLPHDPVPLRGLKIHPVQKNKGAQVKVIGGDDTKTE
jgi:hypothetical protein